MFGAEPPREVSPKKETWKTMPKPVPRLAMWTMVLVLLAATLSSISPAVQAKNPSSYAIKGYVHIGTAIPVPAGVTVDLISGATHDVFSVTTGRGGNFTFTSAETNGELGAGYWGLWVPAAGNVSLGTSCSPCAILPAQVAPVYQYETASELTSTTAVREVNNVSLDKESVTIFGNATVAGGPAIGADVELLAPNFNGLVLYNNTTRAVGNYSIRAPYGTWVLRTTLPGVPTNEFDYQQVTVNSSTVNSKDEINGVNPDISNYLTYGTIYQASNPSEEVPFGGNVTLFDPSTGAIYSEETPGGGFYDVGTYPTGFTGAASNTFDVILQTIGYSTVWYPLTVSGSDPTGGANPHNVQAAAQFTPAVYNTTLTYSPGFQWLNTTTDATLTNDSVLPELANASVGQLWAQLGLDWDHSLNFSGSDLSSFEGWLNSSGAFFPVGASQGTINGTGYNESAGGTFTFDSGCSASSTCGLTTSAGLSYTWAKDYDANGTIPVGLKTYTATFDFRHPTNFQTFNYTVVLPKGFVLEAGQSVSGANLVPEGPNGTWTKFTIDSQAENATSSTATLTFVKYANITANVTASVSQFAFSKSNVLNASHGNYSVIVGLNQNVTFSATSSTFPTGTNATSYAWTFGDGGSTTTTKAITYHTYTAGAKEYNGTLSITSSGGSTASVAFHVYVGNGGITGSIVSNATAYEKRMSGTTPYLMVNWSTSLQFNATGYASSLYAGGPAGILSVASWNASAGPYNTTSNLTASAGAYVPGNFTVTFNDGGTGAGADTEYLTDGNVSGTLVPFLGWQYNITLRLWDADGRYLQSVLVVLVRDTEKPTAVATIQNNNGVNVTSSGVVENASHVAGIRLVGAYSSDPNGGSIIWYNWTITNSGNASVNMTIPIRNASGLRAPAYHFLTLDPQSKAYTVNLTVTDRAGNTNYNVASLTVAINTSTRPVLAVENLTGPTTMSDGDHYTFWVNVTDTIGANSTAQGVSVLFYLLPPSGSGSQIPLGTTPSSVVFYGYTNGTVNTTSAGTGSISIRYNQTFRAVMSFSPGRTGTWDLWVNATATNEFAPDYSSGDNEAHVTVSLNPSLATEYLEIGVVVVVVAAVLLLAVFWYRRSRARPVKSGGSSSRGGSSKKEKADEPDDDDSD